MWRILALLVVLVLLGTGIWLVVRSPSETGPLAGWAQTPQVDLPSDPVASTAAARALADAMQPTVVLQARDGFWPISLQAVFRERTAARPSVCRGTAGQTEQRRECTAVPAASALRWNGGDDEFLDYPPSSLDVGTQRRAAARALGLAGGVSTPAEEQQRTAQTYFYVTPGLAGAVGVQYWFYYAYNYEPIRTALGEVGKGGLHEGDLEHVAVLLARDGRPVYAWLARHEREGQRFTWEEGALQRDDADSPHLRVYPAIGSHATYEECGTKRRTTTELTDATDVINDTIDCRAPTIEFSHDTPLVNLAMTSWACWHGRLGFSPHYQGLRGNFLANGPLSPLLQQKYPTRAKPPPCEGAPEPPEHGDEREEAPESPTAPYLQRHGGKLSGLFDGCPGWDQLPPGPVAGYLVACDDGLLRRFTASGLTGDDVTKATCLRLVAGEERDCRGGVVPAVYHVPDRAQLDELRLASDRPLTPRVFAAVRRRGFIYEATFDEVALRADAPLRLDRRRSRWALVDDAGRVVARARMDKTRVIVDPAPPTELRARRRAGEIEVSFVASTAENVSYRVIAAPTAAELNDSRQPVRVLSRGSAGHDEQRLGKRRVRYSLVIASRDAAFVQVVALRHGSSRSARVPVSDG